MRFRVTLLVPRACAVQRRTRNNCYSSLQPLGDSLRCASTEILARLRWYRATRSTVHSFFAERIPRFLPARRLEKFDGLKLYRGQQQNLQQQNQCRSMEQVGRNDYLGNFQQINFIYKQFIQANCYRVRSFFTGMGHRGATHPAP